MERKRMRKMIVAVKYKIAVLQRINFKLIKVQLALFMKIIYITSPLPLDFC